MVIHWILESAELSGGSRLEMLTTTNECPCVTSALVCVYQATAFQVSQLKMASIQPPGYNLALQVALGGA